MHDMCHQYMSKNRQGVEQLTLGEFKLKLWLYAFGAVGADVISFVEVSISCFSVHMGNLQNLRGLLERL